MPNKDGNLFNNKLIIITLGSILGAIILTGLFMSWYFLVNQAENVSDDNIGLGAVDIDNNFKQDNTYNQNDFDDNIKDSNSVVNSIDIHDNNSVQLKSLINFDKQKFNLVSHNSFNKEIIVPDDENFIDGFSHPNEEKYIFTDKYLDLLKQKSGGKFNNQIIMDVYDLNNFSQTEFADRAYGEVLQNTKNIIKHQDFETYFGQYGLVFPVRPCSIIPSKIKFIDTPTLRGVRVVSLACIQEFAPITENNPEYMFFGISKNEQKHIIFSYGGLGNKDLTKYYDKEDSCEDRGYICDDTEAIAEATRYVLKNSPEENFTPTIQELDNFIESIVID